MLKGTDDQERKDKTWTNKGQWADQVSGSRRGLGRGEMAETQVCRDVVTERPKNLGCSLAAGISPRGFPRAGTADASEAGPTSGHADSALTPGLTAKPWATFQPHLYARDRIVQKPRGEIA